MQQPYQAVTQVGLVHFMAFPFAQKGEGDIVGSIERIAADEFFSFLEVTSIPEADRDAVRAIAESAHLQLGFGAHPTILGGKLNPNSTDDDVRQAAITQLKPTIDEAAQLGAVAWTFLSGSHGGADVEAAELDAMVATTIDLCRYAGERGLAVTCEQFDRSIEKKCLIGPAAITKTFADRVSAEVDNFGICLDLSHLPILDEQASETVPLLGQHFNHAHAGNAYLGDTSDPMYGDQHPYFGYPGGVNDVPELTDYIEVLWRTGYFQRDCATRLPVFSFEVKPGPDHNIEFVLANTKRVFLEAWGLAKV
jgi:sugar phosphate isomerase/epimerase